jgi:DNA-binding NarL/FixJ family response regulator
VLVDKHTLVRAGLRSLLENRSEFKVVGEASQPSDALKLVAGDQPDVILLELDWDPDKSLEFIPQFLVAAEKARVLLVTGERDERVHQRAARLGAMGVVSKEQPIEVLVKAIIKVNAGEVWFDRSTMADVLREFSRSNAGGPRDPETDKISTLSPREREVILLIGEGLKNHQIAQKLFLSEITVRHHLTSIFAKLGISDRLELIIYAYQHGLAQLPR